MTQRKDIRPVAVGITGQPNIVPRRISKDARLAASVVDTLGAEPRLFVLNTDDASVSVYSERPNEHLARIIVQRESLFADRLDIVDHAFVIPDSNAVIKRSFARTKTEEDLAVEQFMLDIWNYENADRIVADQVDPYELGPGTMWKTTAHTGPILATDLKLGMVILNKNPLYEMSMKTALENRGPSRDCYDSITYLANVVLPHAVEYPVARSVTHMPS